MRPPAATGPVRFPSTGIPPRQANPRATIPSPDLAPLDRADELLIVILSALDGRDSLPRRGIVANKGYAMKTSEHKIKKTMPFDAVPAFLRRLADAIEGRSDLIPEEWYDRAAPLSKLAVKGKWRSDGWEMKVKLKADLSSELPADDSAIPKTGRVDVTSEPIERHYKQLKKRMKTAFKIIGEAIENQHWPDSDTLNAFLADADHMTAFAGDHYGESCYPAFREACRNLAKAFGTRDWDGFQGWYGSLNQQKKNCHKAFK